MPMKVLQPNEFNFQKIKGKENSVKHEIKRKISRSPVPADLKGRKDLFQAQFQKNLQYQRDKSVSKNPVKVKNYELNLKVDQPDQPAKLPNQFIPNKQVLNSQKKNTAPILHDIAIPQVYSVHEMKSHQENLGQHDPQEREKIIRQLQIESDGLQEIQKQIGKINSYNSASGQSAPWRGPSPLPGGAAPFQVTDQLVLIPSKKRKSTYKLSKVQEFIIQQCGESSDVKSQTQQTQYAGVQWPVPDSPDSPQRSRIMRNQSIQQNLGPETRKRQSVKSTNLNLQLKVETNQRQPLGIDEVSYRRSSQENSQLTPQVLLKKGAHSSQNSGGHGPSMGAVDSLPRLPLFDALQSNQQITQLKHGNIQIISKTSPHEDLQRILKVSKDGLAKDHNRSTVLSRINLNAISSIYDSTAIKDSHIITIKNPNAEGKGKRQQSYSPKRATMKEISGRDLVTFAKNFQKYHGMKSNGSKGTLPYTVHEISDDKDGKTKRIARFDAKAQRDLRSLSQSQSSAEVKAYLNEHGFPTSDSPRTGGSSSNEGHKNRRIDINVHQSKYPQIANEKDAIRIYQKSFAASKKDLQVDGASLEQQTPKREKKRKRKGNRQQPIFQNTKDIRGDTAERGQETNSSSGVLTARIPQPGQQPKRPQPIDTTFEHYKSPQIINFDLNLDQQAEENVVLIVKQPSSSIRIVTKPGDGRALGAPKTKDSASGISKDKQINIHLVKGESTTENLDSIGLQNTGPLRPGNTQRESPKSFRSMEKTQSNQSSTKQSIQIPRSGYQQSGFQTSNFKNKSNLGTLNKTLLTPIQSQAANLKGPSGLGYGIPGQSGVYIQRQSHQSQSGKAANDPTHEFNDLVGGSDRQKQLKRSCDETSHASKTEHKGNESMASHISLRGEDQIEVASGDPPLLLRSTYQQHGAIQFTRDAQVGATRSRQEEDDTGYNTPVQHVQVHRRSPFQKSRNINRSEFFSRSNLYNRNINLMQYVSEHEEELQNLDLKEQQLLIQTNNQDLRSQIILPKLSKLGISLNKQAQFDESKLHRQQFHARDKPRKILKSKRAKLPHISSSVEMEQKKIHQQQKQQMVESARKALNLNLSFDWKSNDHDPISIRQTSTSNLASNLCEVRRRGDPFSQLPIVSCQKIQNTYNRFKFYDIKSKPTPKAKPIPVNQACARTRKVTNSSNLSSNYEQFRESLMSAMRLSQMIESQDLPPEPKYSNDQQSMNIEESNCNNSNQQRFLSKLQKLESEKNRLTRNRRESNSVDQSKADLWKMKEGEEREKGTLEQQGDTRYIWPNHFASPTTAQADDEPKFVKMIKNTSIDIINNQKERIETASSLGRRDNQVPLEPKIRQNSTEKLAEISPSNSGQGIKQRISAMLSSKKITRNQGQHKSQRYSQAIQKLNIHEYNPKLTQIEEIIASRNRRLQDRGTDAGFQTDQYAGVFVAEGLEHLRIFDNRQNNSRRQVIPAAAYRTPKATPHHSPANPLVDMPARTILEQAQKDKLKAIQKLKQQSTKFQVTKSILEEHASQSKDLDEQSNEAKVQTSLDPPLETQPAERSSQNSGGLKCGTVQVSSGNFNNENNTDDADTKQQARSAEFNVVTQQLSKNISGIQQFA